MLESTENRVLRLRFYNNELFTACLKDDKDSRLGEVGGGTLLSTENVGHREMGMLRGRVDMERSRERRTSWGLH